MSSSHDPLSPAAHPTLNGARILIVDGDEHVHAHTRELLAPYGCVVDSARSGAEARSMICEHGPCQRYDFIVADLNLPDVCGGELYLPLKESMEVLPMALMAGFGYDSTIRIVKARRAGLRYVLFKPFRLDQLLPVIEHYLPPRANSGRKPPAG